MTTLRRLSKHLSSELRLCSRREADGWIETGRVLVNGTKAELGLKVKPGDVLTVRGDGETPTPPRKFIIPTEATSTSPILINSAVSHLPRLYLAHKEARQICDRTKRGSFFQAIEAKGAPHGLLLVSGLDVMASGLMLLTDSSRLKELIERHPLNQVFHVSIARKVCPVF